MIDYAAGDVVVCINAATSPNFPGTVTTLIEGALYRIASFKECADGLAVNLLGGPVPVKGCAWDPARFRKVLKDDKPADEDFSAFIKTMKPKQKALPAPAWYWRRKEDGSYEQI